MTSYDNVFTLEDQIKQIKLNQDYSPEGKTRAINKVKDQLGTVRGQALSQLKSDWGRIKTRGLEIRAAREKAIENEAKRWDWQRLNYMTERVKSAIENANSLRDIENAWQAASQSGDKHAIKAWSETGPNKVTPKYGLEAVSLVGSMTDAAAKYSRPPEFDALDQKADALIQEAKELENITRLVSEAFTKDPSLDLSWAVNEEFKTVRGDCRLSEAWDGERGIKVTLELGE